MRTALIYCLLFISPPAWSAQTNTIDFQLIFPTSADDPFFVGNTYTEKGFIFGAVDGLYGFVSYRTTSPNYTGSKSLFRNTTDGFTSFSRTNCGFFDLFGMQVARVSFPAPLSGTLTFNGYFANQLVVSTNVHFAGAYGVQTLNFTGFTNLTEVRWPATPMIQFDNLRVVSGTNPPPSAQIRISDINSLVVMPLAYLHVGKQYVLQRSSNLIDWTNVSSFIPTSPAWTGFDVYYPDLNPHVFYRLQWTQ